MAKILTKAVRGKETAAPARIEMPRRVRLGTVLVRAKQALREVMLSAGTDVLMAMLEDDRTALCGPKHSQWEQRKNHRHGYDTGPLVLGGRKVAVRKPRVRSIEGGEEVELPTWRQFTDEDPLTDRALEQMLVGVTTRKYERSLEALPEGLESQGTSRSSVSRRFVARTSAQVETFLARSLKDEDYPVVMIDGTGFGDHLMLVAMGIDGKGEKHVLGVREGTTESEGVCRSLLQDLIDRGLEVERARLFVIDGGKGIRKAIRDVFEPGPSDSASFSRVLQLIPSVRPTEKGPTMTRGGCRLAGCSSSGIRRRLPATSRTTGFRSKRQRRFSATPSPQRFPTQSTRPTRLVSLPWE
jgi:hypothetical protein